MIENDTNAVREQTLKGVQRYLEKERLPRVEMALIVAGTGCSGFLASVVLLHLGLEALWLRYSLAVGLAYLAFLLLVWLWLLVQRRPVEPSIDLLDVVDAADGATSLLDGGAGGEFGGGGASSHFGDVPPAGLRPSIGASEGGGGGLDFDLSCDELLLLLAVAAAVGAAIVACAYVVVTAPAFFAEVLLDGALSYGLYRRLRHLDRRHWLEPAVRRTAGPVLVVVVFFVIAGLVMQSYAPEARSIGGVWLHFTQAQP